MNAQNPLTTLVVGRLREAEDVVPVRDVRQRARVAEIAAASDFAYAVGNPFTAEVGDYTGPFMFLYYTKNGDMHGKRIGRTGRVLRHIIAGADGNTKIVS